MCVLMGQCNLVVGFQRSKRKIQFNCTIVQHSVHVHEKGNNAMYIKQELLFLKIWNLTHPIKALWKAGRMQLFNETRLVQRVQEEEDGVWPCKKWKARLKSQGSKIIGTNTEKCVQLCDQNINIHTESKTECVICSWQVWPWVSDWAMHLQKSWSYPH